MSASMPMEALAPVAAALRRMGVEFYIGGSVACVRHGVPRSTVDVDLIANLRTEHAGALAEALRDDFYADQDMIRDEIHRRGSFNVIHLPTMHKVDIFIAGQRPFDESVLRRATSAQLAEDDDREFPIASAEDVILSKLEWYRAGGETSERQWLDVIGVMKVQGDNLDIEYLRRWAGELEVADLLERALREAS